MKIAISSASNNNVSEKYKDIARKVANYLASNNHDLIWGSCSVSLMGICYEEFSKFNRNIYGYTTNKYKDDIDNLNNAKHVICEDTYILKKEMFINADVLLMLPGGTGTISEFFSYLEEIRSNDNKKLLIVYNEDNHFDSMFNLLNDLVKRKFNDDTIYDYFKVVNNLEELDEVLGID
ncbi:MAG: hypothetical protein E7163_02240 [Firmicutes bacterium]|nr:hypothetical protein [Bacillota bacterium]